METVNPFEQMEQWIDDFFLKACINSIECDNPQYKLLMGHILKGILQERTDELNKLVV